MRGLFYLFSRFGALVYLMRHPLVPRWVKAIPVLALFYVVWPRDLLLDFPPQVGFLDDFIVVLILTNVFFWLAPRYARRPEDDGRTVQADFHLLDEEKDHPADDGSGQGGSEDKSGDDQDPKRRE